MRKTIWRSAQYAFVILGRRRTFADCPACTCFISSVLTNGCLRISGALSVEWTLSIRERSSLHVKFSKFKDTVAKLVNAVILIIYL